MDHGTYPFVTSSSSSTAGIPAGTGVAPQTVKRVLGVAKAYTTRVGEGPFPTELMDTHGEGLRQAGREFGATTGRPRRCGWFDALAVKYAAQLTGSTELILTKLDILSGLGNISICHGYSGQEGYPADLEALDSLEPELMEMPGWEEPLTDTRKYTDLPRPARVYVEKIEELVGVPITHISLGPGRNEVISK